jgi:glyoxylase-like metal-dependent hydrolase (beta-lactamase superfamily II)
MHAAGVAYDAARHDAVAIDPVLDYDPVGSATFTESADALSEFIRQRELKLHDVLETHAHADHLSGCQILAHRFGARGAIGAGITEVQKAFQRIFELPPTFPMDGSQFDVLLEDGALLSAGNLTVSVLATPGHTPACLSYLIGDAVFTGDALFMEDYGTGRCDFPKGSADALFTFTRGESRYATSDGFPALRVQRSSSSRKRVAAARTERGYPARLRASALALQLA